MASIELVKFPDIDEMNSYFCRGPFIYPWDIFFYNQFEWMFLKDITILYGNNGSGKSTILKLINSKINNVKSESELFSNDSILSYQGRCNPFSDMVRILKIRNCENEYGETIYPTRIRFIASDDIFKKISDRAKYNSDIMRNNNTGDFATDSLISKITVTSEDDVEYLMKLYKSRRKNAPKFDVNTRFKMKMQSNGESALTIFSESFEEGGLYLLDEPENSLSPIFQLELMKMIDEAVKLYNCQFIIATHSPLLLSLKDAVIYNLDKSPVIPEKWNELDNVKIYYEFFKKHEKEFESKNDEVK